MPKLPEQSRRGTLPPLTRRGREIVAYLMNTVAFGSHGNDAELATMARHLGTSAGRLMPTLRRLQRAGWLTVEEGSLSFVYPTLAAIKQHGRLSEAQAQNALRRLRKTGRK